MSLYHADRRKVRETFEIPLGSRKEKLECTVFETWRDADQGKVVRCGLAESVEISITTGISEKLSSSIEGTLSASIGPKYLTTITAAIKATLGREVNWSQSTTTKRSFTMTAPECGYYSLTTYQLCREYDLSYFQRGGWLFGEKYWDRIWTKTIVEMTGTHDGIPDKGYDEHCKCPPSPGLECDGRLALDFGSFSMRVPYKISANDSFLIVLAGQMVKFTFSDKKAAARGLHSGIAINVPTSSIPEPMLFLGSIPEGSTDLEATIHMYEDKPVTEPADVHVEVEYLLGTVLKTDVMKPEDFLQR